MADEEKSNSAEIDDWLDDFEEADKTGAQIDQSDLDALFSGDDAAATTPAPAAPAAAQPADNGPIDQSAIDALFGDEAPAAAPAPAAPSGGDAIDQSDIDALFGDVAGDETPAAAAPAAPSGGDAIDQSDIDALFGDMAGDAPPAAAAAPAAPSGGDAIDQSDIDALLSGGDAPAAAPSPAADDSGPVSQDDIDALFGDTAAPAAPTTAAGPSPAADSGPVDQSEIDALFGDMDSGTIDAGAGSQGAEDLDQLFNEFNDAGGGESKAVKTEEVDFTELLDEDKGGEESFTLGEEDFSLSADDFTLGTEDSSSGGETIDAEALFGNDEETQALPDFLAAGPSGEETITPMTEKKGKKGLPIPAFLKNKKVIGTAATLSVALLVGGYLYLHPNEKLAIVMPEPPQEAATKAPEAANTPPHAIGSEYKMPADGGALAILLTAEDKEGDQLSYEITNAPAHGRISGEPPRITYLPNNNFPGEDRFTFLARDGHGASAPTEILITGPKLAEPAAVVTAAAKPKPAGIGAKNITLSMRSTESLELDWRKIWREANNAPFGKNVGVQLLETKLHGQLTKIGPGLHHYRPDPYFSGSDSIKYRFHRGKTLSKIREIRLVVTLGAPPPQIRLGSLAKAYQVGARVVVDASATRDDKRESLRFNWEQTAGTPVRFKTLNDEGSIVSFIMPSSFSNTTATGPEIMVTAIDDSGQEDQRKITIRTVPRQRAALWRGVANDGGVIAVEPDCPQGRCPGEMLPWPYPN